MSFRAALLVPLAFGVLAGPPHRAASTTRYHIESKNDVTVDLSGLGMPSQQQSVGLSSWVALTLSDSGGGHVVHVVVDSVRYSGTAPIPQASFDSAKGGTVHGFVASDGRVKGLASKPAENLAMAEIQGVINAMFPRIKGGARTGDAWVDTTEITNTVGGSNTKVRYLITYTAGGSESVGGVAAMKLSAASQMTISGTVENPMAGTMEIEGTGSGTSSFLMGGDGRFLGGTTSSTLDQKMKMAMSPSPIPVKAVRSVTVTLLQ
jgi:hypothetical protein